MPLSSQQLAARLALLCAIAGCNLVPNPTETGSAIPLYCRLPMQKGNPQCVCSQVPNSENVVERCTRSSFSGPAGTTPQCCRSYLTVGVTMRTPYYCACYAVRCAVGAGSGAAATCECATAFDPPNDGKTTVNNCADFVAANTGAVCCSDGHSCRCGVGLACTKTVPACGPELVCAATGASVQEIAESCP